MNRAPIAVLAMLLSTPGVADAQFPWVDRLVAGVTDVNIAWVYGSLDPKTSNLAIFDAKGGEHRWGLTGATAEVSLGVGFIGRVCHESQTTEDGDDAKVPAARKEKDDTLEWRWKCPLKLDTVRTLTGVAMTGANATYTGSVRVDTVEHPTVIQLETAIGYGVLYGFRGTASGGGLRASLLEFPTVGVYATYVPPDVITGYLGARVGVGGLQALQAQVPDTLGNDVSYLGNASTFLFGASAGLTVDIGDLGVFVEAGYMRRCFPSVTWAAANINTVPLVLPKELNLSGWTFSFGAQVEFSP